MIFFQLSEGGRCKIKIEWLPVMNTTNLPPAVKLPIAGNPDKILVKRYLCRPKGILNQLKS